LRGQIYSNRQTTRRRAICQSRRHARNDISKCAQLSPKLKPSRHGKTNHKHHAGNGHARHVFAQLRNHSEAKGHHNRSPPNMLSMRCQSICATTPRACPKLSTISHNTSVATNGTGSVTSAAEVTTNAENPKPE
jgi:hypothetical protein